jgi:hypothetical protein
MTRTKITWWLVAAAVGALAVLTYSMQSVEPERHCVEARNCGYPADGEQP